LQLGLGEKDLMNYTKEQTNDPTVHSLAEYTHIIVPFVLNEVKDESSVMIFEEKDTPNCDYGDNELEDSYENVDESVTKAGTEEKGHFPYTVISEPLYVSLEDHHHKHPEQRIFPSES
jgi:hypothetical protein